MVLTWIKAQDLTTDSGPHPRGRPTLDNTYWIKPDPLQPTSKSGHGNQQSQF